MGILDEPDVLDRIAVDKEQIGESAPASTTPSLPGWGLRIPPERASSWPLSPVAIFRDLGRGVPAHHLGQLGAVSPHQPRIEEDVGPEGRLHPVLLGERVQPQSVPGNHLQRGSALRAASGTGFRSSSSRKGCRLPPNPLLRHQPRRGVVNQVTVVDDRDAGGDGLLDRCRGVGVHVDVGSPVPGRLDGGPELCVGEGRNPHGARGRHAATGRELDLGGADRELLAHPALNLGHPVGDDGRADDLGAGQRSRPPREEARRGTGSRRDHRSG